jgi:hypothetical protein
LISTGKIFEFLNISSLRITTYSINLVGGLNPFPFGTPLGTIELDFGHFGRVEPLVLANVPFTTIYPIPVGVTSVTVYPTTITPRNTYYTLSGIIR